MRPVIGLDFGTTNSAIAVADADNEATLASFSDGSGTTTSFRSILYFPLKDHSSTAKRRRTLKTRLWLRVSPCALSKMAELLLAERRLLVVPLDTVGVNRQPSRDDRDATANLNFTHVRAHQRRAFSLRQLSQLHRNSRVARRVVKLEAL